MSAASTEGTLQYTYSLLPPLAQCSPTLLLDHQYPTLLSMSCAAATLPCVPQGTAFYALQSCANHSCVPGATIEGEASGEASILALTTIRPGEEVTISYIDEEQGYRDRQAALRDYGFKCCCKKCEADKAGTRKTTGKRKASKK